MRHADQEGVHAVRAGRVDDRLEAGDERLAALEAEALLVRPFAREELLELGRANQALEREALLVGAQVERAGRLELVADPVALAEVVDEHELHADLRAVDLRIEEHNDLCSRAAPCGCSQVALSESVLKSARANH